MPGASAAPPRPLRNTTRPVLPAARQMKLKRSPLYFSTLTTLAFLAGVAVAWYRFGNWSAPENSPGEGESPSESTDTGLTGSGKAGTVSVVSHETDELRNRIRQADLSSTDLSQTSWQDPFRSELWDAVDCQFEPDRIEFAQDGKATFLRPYRRARIELTASTRSQTESSSQWPAQFEVHLIDANSDSATVLIVTATEASVSHREGTRWSFIRQNSIEPTIDGNESGTTFRINVTGSRLLISRGSRLLLNCAQPSASGANFYIQIAARENELRVRKLRIEGE